ncbi:MAG TPA: GNAT family N-acetyltransferase, partial [Gemmatimonadaceae bacterium]|nr:GNAT family N-acetyltransferase [Gemmatimonadaceae bacterium]
DIRALAQWARHRGYAFLRFTHANRQQLEEVGAAGGIRGEDVFPFYREPQEELLVSQEGTDDEVLAGFQAVARRNIRGALKVGYRIASGDSPEMLRGLWPLFQKLSDRKGISFRPLESFVALLGQARPYGAARVYSALLGERAVQALIIVRDGVTAHYISGALDMGAIGDLESPSVLLHWHAMRDFAREGVTYYNLGTRSGVVHRFKQKFRPVEQRNPPAEIVVTNPIPFWLWSRVGMKVLRPVWPALKRQLARARSAGHTGEVAAAAEQSDGNEA